MEKKAQNKQKKLELEILELESKLAPNYLDKEGNPIPESEYNEGAEC